MDAKNRKAMGPQEHRTPELHKDPNGYLHCFSLSLPLTRPFGFGLSSPVSSLERPPIVPEFICCRTKFLSVSGETLREGTLLPLLDPSTLARREGGQECKTAPKATLCIKWEGPRMNKWSRLLAPGH